MTIHLNSAGIFALADSVVSNIFGLFGFPEAERHYPMRALAFSSVLAVGLATLPGCIVIPIGDLLKTPRLEERTLAEGRGFFRKEKIAVLELRGFIGMGSGEFPWTWTRQNMVGEVRSRLKEIRKDSQVKAVVLRISSTGGEVTACDMIHHDLARFKKDTGIPVVASISEHGASGAYYIAMATDRVLAQPTAIVGSIGVMMQSYDLSDLLEKIGVRVAPVKSAEHKDLNSPFRRMSPEEREVLQKLVNDLYERFVGVVDEGRPALGADEVRALADGRVVSGEAAASAGLVDATGYFSDAIEAARELADISSPTIILYSRGGAGAADLLSSFGGQSVAGSAPATAPGFELRVKSRGFRRPELLYLWEPDL